MGERRYSSTILDLGSRWRWVVSFTHSPLYPRYPLDRRPGAAPEPVAVYCENHKEHTNTLCGQNAETLYIRIQSVPHRKHNSSSLCQLSHRGSKWTLCLAEIYVTRDIFVIIFASTFVWSISSRRFCYFDFLLFGSVIDVSEVHVASIFRVKCAVWISVRVYI
jgi:hypothetical protein